MKRTVIELQANWDGQLLGNALTTAPYPLCPGYPMNGVEFYWWAEKHILGQTRYQSALWCNMLEEDDTYDCDDGLLDWLEYSGGWTATVSARILEVIKRKAKVIPFKQAMKEDLASGDYARATNPKSALYGNDAE